MTTRFVAILTLLAACRGSDPASTPPSIRALDGDWGVPLDNVSAVLSTTADTLWRAAPDRELPPIVVRPDGGPITLFERTPEGAVEIRLAVHGPHWSQIAFQFAHEFCHVLCNFRPPADPRHQWFEESVCETASLFALRRLAESWAASPPYPNWKTYAPAFRDYADERLKRAALPEGATFKDWFGRNIEALSKNAGDRERNLVVASMLLPLFEASPHHWAAVAFLNADAPADSFDQFLARWRDRSPPAHHAFIDRLAALFR